MSSPDLTALLARHVATLEAEQVAAADIERLRHCVLDWIGVTLAGASSSPARAVRAIVADGPADASATVLGTDRRCSAREAALANGVAAHALELDDIARAMGGHPSASICAATLALAETRSADGADVAAAILAGYDVACQVAIVVGPAHSAAGWHATGTIGTLASAAACARVLRLDEDAVHRSLGLAATQAAGLKVSAGTAGKSLHTGKAAADGMLAALLAERGATAPARAVDELAAAAGAGLDSRSSLSPIEPGVRSIVFRHHAACGLTNPVIDAILDLRATHAFTADDVERVEVEAGPAVLDVCSYNLPKDELEARFSLPFCAALALAGRDTGQAGFTAETVADPELTGLCSRVVATKRDAAPARVTIELRDGRRLSAVCESEPPASDRELPAQWLRLVAKFTALTVPLLGEEATARAIELVRAPGLDGLLAATVSAAAP